MIWKTTNALGQEVTWYSEDEVKKILYKNCSYRKNFNIFGLPDKDCCYKYGKYCKDVAECEMKEGLENG